MPSHCFKVFVVALFSVASVAQAEVSIADAWVRAVPPVSKTSAAYFTLTNTGEQQLVLNGASADFSGSAELHDMSMHEGRRSMRHIDRLPLAPGESVTFGSGGLHVMLFALKRVPVQGETVEVCLSFEQAPSLCAPFAVRSE